MKVQASFVDCLAMRDEAEKKLEKVRNSLSYLGSEGRQDHPEAKKLLRDEENHVVFLRAINAVIEERLSLSQID